MNTKLSEQTNTVNQQNQGESEIDAAVARGSGEVPAEKFEAFKSTMAKMHQAVTQMGTAGAAPAKAAGQTQPPRKPGETQAASVTSPTKTTGSKPAGSQMRPGHAINLPSGEAVDLSWAAQDQDVLKSAQEVIGTLTKKNTKISKKEVDTFVNVMKNLNVHGLKVVPK